MNRFLFKVRAEVRRGILPGIPDSGTWSSGQRFVGGRCVRRSGNQYRFGEQPPFPGPGEDRPGEVLRRGCYGEHRGAPGERSPPAPHHRGLHRRHHLRHVLHRSLRGEYLGPQRLAGESGTLLRCPAGGTPCLVRPGRSDSGHGGLPLPGRRFLRPSLLRRGVFHHVQQGAFRGQGTHHAR